MKQHKRIVIKVGTSTLCHSNGSLNFKIMDKLAMVLSELNHTNHDVILVTSGAIGAGMNRLGLHERPHCLAQKQATAAIGQSHLMNIYSRLFDQYGSLTGQILVTKSITEDPIGHDNVIATINELLKMKVIPIVNENDSVATEEIVYGDNDTLSAIVASFIKADLLVILSDIDGLYECDPTKNPNAKLIDRVENIDDVYHLATGSHSSQGTGGMVTKLHAAQIAKDAGIPTIITNGQYPSNLYDICDGQVIGTYFTAGDES